MREEGRGRQHEVEWRQQEERAILAEARKVVESDPDVGAGWFLPRMHGRTGRPLTNAAVIMIIVFIAFGVTGPIPPTELGLTLAMAVFLDATVVRVMLVPATMALLGEKNWYAPKWLQKILPHVNFSH